MVMNDPIRTEIMKGADASMLRKIAVDNGMISLRMDAANKVMEGSTTIEEVMRVPTEGA
jgi:type II secretory ATPase GspE/PulE/Tfp pilus assembly ATPase PilB-like protein